MNTTVPSAGTGTAGTATGGTSSPLPAPCSPLPVIAGGVPDDAAARLERYTAAERLRWAAETFGGRAAIGTSFQGAGIVALHLAAEAGLKLAVFTLDTGLLFPETLALKAALEARFGIEIESVRPRLSLDAQAAEYGAALWERDPDLCCQLRKVMPLSDKLASLDCWLTGVRREQAASRAVTGILERNERAGGRVLWKLNPLADWSRNQVWAHIRANDLPYNPLHDAGYRSIGCSVCTRPSGACDADERAGRWTGFNKTECGIHTFLKQSSTTTKP
ncbi:MAG: phosphoadenylyl-sulfate reductase [Puniceicoccales bacterium]|jgi:phosphoadenosine phosphosulfate reductase|nr:phosphoadenylyl-sulfate reductase [Puniceicoccales bacterium]